MTGAYDAMRTGYVDETWAKEHHEYWYNEVKSGRPQARGRRRCRCGNAPRSGDSRTRRATSSQEEEGSDEDDPCSRCGRVRGGVVRLGGGEAAAGRRR